MIEKTAPLSAKRYRGSTADERRTQRRTRLIEAAVQVYGERGYRNASVKAVCNAAGLTERYFYESFANSEALLVATFEAVLGVLIAEITAARDAAGEGPEARVRALLGAYYASLQRDPPSARVFLVEIGGVSPAVDTILNNSLDRFGVLLLEAWGSTADEADPLVTAGVTGAVIQIALAWIAGRYAQSLESVVNAALRICSVLAPAEKRA